MFALRKPAVEVTAGETTRVGMHILRSVSIIGKPSNNYFHIKSINWGREAAVLLLMEVQSHCFFNSLPKVVSSNFLWLYPFVQHCPACAPLNFYKFSSKNHLSIILQLSCQKVTSLFRDYVLILSSLLCFLGGQSLLPPP